MIQGCENCRFAQKGVSSLRCHRCAPAAYDFLRYYQLELLRDIAWSVRDLARREEADPSDDIETEATEAMNNATWPDVDPLDWCGEWEAKLPE